MRARNATAEERSSPMDWVEVQGKTVDLAVDVAVRELGLRSKEDAKVEIIQEPRAGFIGVGGRDAIVKVTKEPAGRRRRRRRGKKQGSVEKKADSKGSPREKTAREKKPNRPRQEKKVTTSDTGKRESDDRPEQAPIEEQAKVATEFITGLLGAFGLEGSVESRIEDKVLYLDVVGDQTEALVGPKGSVMQSVYELTRTVVQRKTYGAPRMRLDVAGYRERRREALKIYTTKLAEQVIEEKDEVMLEPMNAADRKVIHDTVAEIKGVRSFSEGSEPRRAVVLAHSSGE